MLRSCERFPLYDLDALDACGRALNEACETAHARQSRERTDTIEQSTRHSLAQTILALAATGERDVEELKRYALRELSVRAWRQPVGGPPNSGADDEVRRQSQSGTLGVPAS